jgi:DNA polymerase III subunit chi
LTQVPLEKALPSIAERIFKNGERLAIVAEDDVVLTRLDALLWSYKPDSFLAHGREGDQPIQLANHANLTGVENIALVDGIWRDEALKFGRAFFFFDSETINGARAAWRGLAEKADVDRHYWKQDDSGKWVEGP